MTIAGIVTLVIVVLFALHGLKTGLVKKLTGLLSIVIAAVLVHFLLPYVTQVVKEKTPLYGFVVDRCENVMEDQVFARITGMAKGGEDGSVYDREQIRSLLQQAGVDTSWIDALSDEELRAAAREYLGEYSDQIKEAAAVSLEQLSKVEQTELIKELPVPEFLKRMMINFNNSEGYRKLGAQDFAQYLTRFIANIILNICAFLITMLVTWLIIRIIFAALNLAVKLPVLGFANRVGGLIAGALQGMCVVWLLFMVISLLSGTRIGLQLQNMINDSFILQPVYETNIFLKMVSDAMQRIM